VLSRAFKSLQYTRNFWLEHMLQTPSIKIVVRVLLSKICALHQDKNNEKNLMQGIEQLTAVTYQQSIIQAETK
jgi:hypothetical protein